MQRDNHSTARQTLGCMATHLFDWDASRLRHQKESEQNGKELPHPKEDVNAPLEGAQHVQKRCTYNETVNM